jgi:hypothetical protein
MIILSTLRYGEEAYGSASQAILKILRTHTQQRVKISSRTIRDVSNGEFSLSEMRELNNVKTTTRISTNPRHPIRPFCVEPKKTDEYAYRPTTPKPLFVRASESFGNLQIDPRRIEKTPQHTTVDKHN